MNRYIGKSSNQRTQIPCISADFVLEVVTESEALPACIAPYEYHIV